VDRIWVRVAYIYITEILTKEVLLFRYIEEIAMSGDLGVLASQKPGIKIYRFIARVAL